MIQEDQIKKFLWFLDREGRLCYLDLGEPMIKEGLRWGQSWRHQKHNLDDLAPTLFQVEQVVKGSDLLLTEYRRLSEPLIQGDYMGPLRGETNCALNYLHYLLCLDEVVKKKLDPEAKEMIRNDALELRKNRFPEHLGW
jgi:hypothetical protein